MADAVLNSNKLKAIQNIVASARTLDLDRQLEALSNAVCFLNQEMSRIILTQPRKESSCPVVAPTASPGPSSTSSSV